MRSTPALRLSIPTMTRLSSGADPIETRPGFLALLDRIEGDGMQTVLIEDASRFGRGLITQELGILSLIKRGVRVLTAAGDDLTATDDPFKKAMRQIAGAFAELEKARLVAKLRHARGRIRNEQEGKCEGRKTRIERAERENNPELVKALTEVVEMAKRLRRASPKSGERRSLRKISAELAAAGYLNERGQPFNPNSIKLMLKG